MMLVAINSIHHPGGTFLMSVKREASYERHWFAWVGELEQLRRSVQSLDDYVKDLRERAFARVAKEEIQTGVNHDTWKEEIESAYRPKMKCRERELNATYKGPAAKVLDEIDHRSEIDLIQMFAPDEFVPEPLFIMIELSRSRGASLSVRGEPRLVRAASSELASQLDRASPWWGWLRSKQFQAIARGMGAISAILAAVVLGLTIKNVEWSRVSVSIGFSIVSFTAAYASSRIPGLEIVEPGGQGSTRRVIGILGALGGGLLTNLITYVVTK
jgi:hypothetical protein